MIKHRVISEKVFFEELPEVFKKEIIEKHSEINVDDGWYEFSLEQHGEELEYFGFEKEVKIMFSGFWNQGDGACFSCKSFDPVKFMKSQKICNKFRLLFDNIRVGNLDIYGYVEHSGMYYHENSHTLILEWDYYPDKNSVAKENKIRAKFDEFEEYVQDFIHDKAQEIYSALEKEYDYLTSSEIIEQTLEDQDWEYTLELTL